MEEKNTIKKIIPLLLILIITAGMLTGCSGETETTTSPAPEKPATSQETTNPADSKDATVMEELRKLKELEGKNIKLVEVYNEVVTLAMKNGWDKDELTLKELNAVNATSQTFNSMIKDPSSAHGVDLDAILSATDDLATELDTNIRQRVSVPFAK
ncbi:MAG TPA: hypothetical protein DEF42_17420 [Desulfosporosinus sp.]|nr:hypothetical protein [Desulfosporosinus sp.]